MSSIGREKQLELDGNAIRNYNSYDPENKDHRHTIFRTQFSKKEKNEKI